MNECVSVRGGMRKFGGKCMCKQFKKKIYIFRDVTVSYSIRDIGQ